jgi:hypothetical protein
MDLSSLPRFPNPEPPPAAPAPRVRGCRRTLPLRFLIVLAIWGGLYILREQVTAHTAAREKERAEERAKILHAGRWESIHGDGAILELKDGKFTLTREGAVINSGEYWSDGSSSRLLIWLGTLSREGFPYRVVGEELEVEFGHFGETYFHNRRLSWDGGWRFRRLKD